jgi:hypothetical protein
MTPWRFHNVLGIAGFVSTGFHVMCTLPEFFGAPFGRTSVLPELESSLANPML